MRRATGVWAAFLLLAVACGASSESADGDFGSASPGATDAGAGGPGAATTPAEPPPEQEVESDYEAPVATGSFVWIANPKSGKVAYVDASTLAVKTVDAGNGPTYLAAVPGPSADTTIVLNVLSNDATLLHAGPAGLTTKTLATAASANSLAFSSDGRFAIAWADSRKVASPPKADGFQDVAVLDLTNGTSTILAVGYRPVAVGFAAGSAKAYAVTEDGVSILDLSGAPAVVKNVAVSDDPNDDPGSRDVSVTPDGKTALIRRDGSPAITVVSLDTGARATVTLSGNVTDLDLSDTGDVAVGVVRDTADVAILPVPQILSDPGTFTKVTITGETVGSVVLAPGGKKALLYTNALDVERVTVLDLSVAPPAYRTVRLYSEVLAVFPSPDAAHAVVLHQGTADPSADGGGAAGAFSLLPVANDLPAKIVATNAPPTSVAVTNDHAIVAERDDVKQIFGAYIAKLPELSVHRFALASPPIATGVIAGANRAYVAQLHPEGRLTFFDLDTGVARTLTGFELSSRVVDGSKP